MPTDLPALAGYRGLRGGLLVALKKAQPLTARELAEHFGVTPNALRRHLKALEAAGAVEHRREVRGVGAPVFAYRLTAAAEALFPQGHAGLLKAVLGAVREERGPEGVVALLRREWSGAASEARAALAGLPIGERARRLAVLRSAQGYMAEAVAGAPGLPGAATLREHHCAVREVAEQFPEICAAEQEFIEQVLGVSVERTGHILRGCPACEYRAAAGVLTTSTDSEKA